MAKQRIQSLDIVRGMTVAGMILVNNGYSGSFQTLQHSKWNGLTVCDLVFPFFLFIMGVSIFLSFSSRGFRLTTPVFGKIFKRTVLLLLLGLAINWFDKAIEGNILCFETLRYWAVLQRIAICYFMVSLIALTMNHRYVLPLSCLLLIAYGAILYFGNGYAYDASVNILSRVDNYLFGYDHLYHKSPVDPEGLVGTICSIVNVLLGFYCGMIIKRTVSLDIRVRHLFFAGAIMTAIGLMVVVCGFPLNKRIWSPSYALVTSGLCALLLSVIMWIVDIHFSDTARKGFATSLITGVSEFFKVFGVNALFLYIVSELLAILLGHFGISDRLYGFWTAVAGIPQISSLCYALTYVAICFAAGFPLYRKRIYIKL